MKHILAVDDNKINLLAVKNTFSDNFKVTAVTSGEQALKFLEKIIPDIILLDINMPEMDGFEVMGELRKLPGCESVPIVFLTADNDPETETKCLDLGALDFIAKPVVPAVMRSRIDRILELEDLRRSLADRLERKIQEVSEMKNKSCQDALTGLWNRSYTEEAVNEILGRGGCGALFMIDMDNFKAINDNYGHLAGDNTLKMFADTMRRYSSENDVLCRIGGDEFVMFVNGTNSKAEIGSIADDIIRDLCAKLDECKYETNSSVSIGISCAPDDCGDFNGLYNAADKALYHVKMNGKNSYHFFSEAKEDRAERFGNIVDINYLREFMARSDPNNGSYTIDFESFHHVYNFIRRFIERNERNVQTMLFTIASADGSEPDKKEAEIALEMLECAIFNSLRRVDVSTRYSSTQMIVILMDADETNSISIADRISKSFRKLYTGDNIELKYEAAKMDRKFLAKKK